MSPLQAQLAVPQPAGPGPSRAAAATSARQTPAGAAGAGLVGWTERLPDGYIAVPLTAQQVGAPLRICAVVRKEADPVGGHLVVLRDLLDAKVLLGCVTDADTRVLRWLEIWVQDLDGFMLAAETLSVARDALSNLVLDERWRRQFRQLDEFDAHVIHTGWETANPQPMLVDLATGRPVHLADPDALGGRPWELCRDDALLESRGLPPYSTSLARYLYQPGVQDGADSLFLPLTAGAPANEHTRDLTTALPGGPESAASLVPLNLSGGLMTVREFSPIDLEGFVALLSGRTPEWRGVVHGTTRLPIGKLPADPGASPDGWLFLGRQGQGGRFVERYHLKVRLLWDLLEGVRSLAHRTQRPLLDLKPQSFQVVMEGGGRGLPVLWNCRAVLVDPGNAISLRVPAGDMKYYLPAKPSGVNIYRPPEAAEICRGSGRFTIRRFPDAPGDMTIIEGTFSTRDYVRCAKNDMIWLRIPLRGRRVDLYARLETQPDLHRGELRFRTVPLAFPEPVVAELKAAKGALFTDVVFEITPLLSTPCDLYSMCVMSVLLLLVDSKVQLSEAFDELQALVRALENGRGGGAGGAAPKQTLPERIKDLFIKDKRFSDMLGPQRLTEDGLTYKAALDLLPEDLWWDTLAMIVAMFPGHPDGTCRDLGDAPPSGVHQVFDRALDEVQSLVVRSRSILMVDWTYNREVRGVIDRLRKG